MAFVKSFHLAGIIPIAGQPVDYNMDWSDALMPVAPNYTAVERSVMECAYAGCETIWIICNDDMTPLVKHRIGEWVKDPQYSSNKFVPKSAMLERRIPVYYVPIHPKDRHKRDCLAWSILWGAEAAHYVSSKISKWVKPDRYYVSFPHGVYFAWAPSKIRTYISSERGFYWSFNKKTVRDNELLGFTFNNEDLKFYKSELRRKSTGLTDGFNGPRLSEAERYSARWFTLDKVFGSANMEGSTSIELLWYYRIDSWDGYCTYLGSEHRDKIHRPQKGTPILASNRTWNPLGEDNDEE